MIHIPNGNLITAAQQGEVDVIIHGCNCFHAMGAGIAAQVAEIYPEAWYADKHTQYGDTEKLGTFSAAVIDDANLTVVNLYSQFYPGKNLRFGFMMRGLEYLFRVTFKGTHHKIGIPAIGCGIAGGDPDVIIPAIGMIEKSSKLSAVSNRLFLYDYSNLYKPKMTDKYVFVQKK